jgi:hypothetical protein
MTINLVLAILSAMGLLQGETGGLIEELDASQPRTGFVKLEMTTEALLGAEAANSLNPILLASEEIEWRAFVPWTYDPGRPPGVLVFVSSIDWGGIPEDWATVMDARNLIWISPSQAGASAPVQERIVKAILAPRVIDVDYRVDKERIYIAGFGDGGKVANLVQATDPATFRGGLYICGALAWGDKTPQKIDLMRSNRHVFIRACTDPKEREVRGVYEEYRDAGFEGAELITVQTRRRRLPEPKYIDQAIRHLDGPVVEAADQESR